MLAEHIVSASAIAEVVPGGQKLTKVSVEYDVEIDGEALEVTAYGVRGRQVTKAYTSSSELGAPEASGRFVILELNLEDKAAFTWEEIRMPRPKMPAAGGAPAGGPPPRKNKIMRYSISAELAQCGPVKTVSGETIKADGHTFMTDKSRQPVVEDFKQLVFHNDESGEDLKYCLYIPKGYDGTKAYPLVNYISDAGGCSDDHDYALIFTYGAVSFAQPDEQERHPSFVLVPQVPSGNPMTTDNFTCSPTLDSIVKLIDYIVSEYNIDTNRVYTTGQSMGCMASFEMLLRRNDLFAGALLVAGQWDPVRIGENLGDRNMWIIVSEGDLKAFPTNNAATAELEKNGHKVTRSYWSANMPEQEMNREKERLVALGNNIMYTVLDSETVVPGPEGRNGGAQHLGTWKCVYPWKPVHDWLFEQRLK